MDAIEIPDLMANVTAWEPALANSSSIDDFFFFKGTLSSDLEDHFFQDDY